MGLFSFLSKNKQDRTAEDSGRFISRAEDDALGERARSKRAASAGEGARRGRDGRGAADPVLPEKKRARRRLVGAIALALAAAVGLPMLLDSEPKPLAGDIAIQIPSKDKAAPMPAPSEPSAKADPVAVADTVDRGEEIVEPPRPPVVAKFNPAEVRTAPAKPEAAEPAKAEHAKPEAAREPKPEHKVAPKPEPKAAEARPEKPADKAAAKPAESKPAESKPAEKAAPKPSPKAEEKRAQPPADASRALAILEGKEAAPKEAGADKVVLQVAALGSADKVAELQARLREAGIHSFTQKLSRPGGELIRVKVGPYSRDEADKVRAKLGKLGLPGTPVDQH